MNSLTNNSLHINYHDETYIISIKFTEITSGGGLPKNKNYINIKNDKKPQKIK
jgi:hypothetical protein